MRIATRAVALVYLILTTAGAKPATAPSDQKIAPHDLLGVTIHNLVSHGATEFRVRVNPDGEISLPLVGVVKVRGKTPDEAADEIDNVYKNCPLPTDVSTSVEFVESGDRVTLKSAPVAVGELIQIRMWDVEGIGKETRLEQRVTAEGEVTLSRVGAVKVAGKSEAEVESEVAVLFRERGLLMHLFNSVLRLDGEKR